MNMKNVFLSFLGVLLINSFFASVNQFDMRWSFCNSDGSNEIGIFLDDVCVGESVYIKNLSRRNSDCSSGASIGTYLSEGYYIFECFQGNQWYRLNPVGSTNDGLPANLWNYGQVVELPTSFPISYGGLTFRIRHTGPGVNSLACSGSRERKGNLGVYSPPQIVITPSTTAVCPGEYVELTASGGTSYVWSNGQTANPISVVQNGTFPFQMTYSVTGYDIHGCSSDDLVGINIKRQPKLNLSDISLCQNDPLPLLDASGGINMLYEWYNNSIGGTIISTNSTYQTTQTGTYCVKKTGGNGCANEKCIDVYENPILSEEANFGISYMSVGNGELSVTASLSPLPSNISWDWEISEYNISTGQLISTTPGFASWQNYTSTLMFPGFTFYENHHYKIKRFIWSSDGCLQYKDYIATVWVIVRNGIMYSVEKGEKGENLIEIGVSNDSESNIKLFPNPSKGKFFITSKDNKNIVKSIEIHDFSGKLIYNDMVTINEQIDVSNLVNGIYFVTITSETDREVIRFIKE